MPPLSGAGCRNTLLQFIDTFSRVRSPRLDKIFPAKESKTAVRESWILLLPLHYESGVKECRDFLRAFSVYTLGLKPASIDTPMPCDFAPG